MKTPISGRYRPHFQALADLMAAWSPTPPWPSPSASPAPIVPGTAAPAISSITPIWNGPISGRGCASCPRTVVASTRSAPRRTLRQAAALLGQGLLQPGLMCPLNDDGRCGLYKHRLNDLSAARRAAPPGPARPAGPGLSRLLPLSGAGPGRRLRGRHGPYPSLRGTGRPGAALLGAKAGRLPKVDLTLAQMIAIGPPRL